MHLLIFTGRVMPERAQFSRELKHSVIFPEGKIDVHVSIILNQVTVRVFSPWEWHIFDLRNFVVEHLQSMLAAAGYLLGYAYEIEITRLIAPNSAEDFVFGVDNPFIAQKMEGKFSDAAFYELMIKTSGRLGPLLNRCFTDLMLAIKHPIDTAFYCFRAIEALRHHCGAIYEITDKCEQWKKFREVSGVQRDLIDQIKLAADGVRHGEVIAITGEQRDNLFSKTWDIVEAYLKAIPNNPPLMTWRSQEPSATLS